MHGWAVLLFCAGASSWAGSYDREIAVLSESLSEGDWNQRIQAVNNLGALGPEAAPALARGLEDLDWQVRLTAVHRLGELGEAGAALLSQSLARERCPVVRMNAVHLLAGLSPVSFEAAEAQQEEASEEEACSSWYFAAEGRTRSLRARKQAHARASAADSGGCEFIRYDRPGREVCPAGLRVRGVGQEPSSIDFLMEKPPVGGVALCCPEGVEPDAAAGKAAPQPESVECRLLPMECPASWIEMEPPTRMNRKPDKYRRSNRHKQDATNWIHCCRPTGAQTEEATVRDGSDFTWREDHTIVLSPHYEPQAAGALAGDEPEPLEPYIEPAEPLPVEGMPEREFGRKALKALKKKKKDGPEGELAAAAAAPRRESPPAGRREDAASRKARSLELDSLMAWIEKEEKLARPAGIPGNKKTADETRAAAQAPARGEPSLLIDDGLGESESLERPAAVPPRQAQAFEASGERAGVAREGANAALERKRALGKPEEALSRPAGVAAAGKIVEGDARLMADAGTKKTHDALPELLKALKSPDFRKRARAAEMMAPLGPEAAAAVPALRAALRDENARVRAGAALALGSLTRGTDAAVKDLRRALKDKHADVRYSAAEALGRVGTPAARAAFRKDMGILSRGLIDR